MTSTTTTTRREIPTVRLADGNQVPLIGFGTSGARGEGPGDPGYEAILCAIKQGYRFIDTATCYENEDVVGNAIRAAISEGLVTRQELFVCTKVWCTAHKRESVTRACRESLAKLQLDYVDLYLIHWPIAYQEGLDEITPKDPTSNAILYSETHYTETWLGMEDVKDAGLARSIGLSNFNHHMIDDILAMPCKHRPVALQAECHPYLAQVKLLDYCKSKQIQLIGYSPLGSPNSCARPDQPAVSQDELVVETATKYNKTVAQILIRFNLQRNIPTIPKSVTPERIAKNIQVFDFALDQQDLAKLIDLNRNLRYCEALAGEFPYAHRFYPFHSEY